MSSNSPPSTAVSTDPAQKSSGVLRAAGVMGAATFLSRILGLVREQVFAVMFGAGHATDAFVIAFRIPNLLRDLFAEGAMSAALVPTFVRVRKEKGDRAAWRLAGLVFRVLSVVVSIIAIVGILSASTLVSWYASRFKEVPGKFELTVLMTQIIYPFFPLVALAAAFMGILNACGAFFIPAFSSALFNLVSVLTGVVLSLLAPRFGYEPIVGMSVGVVLGGMVQAFSQLPLLYKKGYHWPGSNESDSVWYRDPDLKRMLFLMVPGTMGLAATQVNIFVNSSFATGEGPAVVSWLNYAFRFMQFPIGLFGVSLAAATLPIVSAHWVDQRLDAFSSTVVRSLKQVFAVNCPAAAGLGFLGIPIISSIFQYGHFTSVDTEQTAWALALYSLGLPFYSGVKVLVPVFYSMGETRIPVVSSVLSVAANLLLCALLVKLFGFKGLAIGTSLTAAFNFLYLLFAFHALNRIDLKDVFKSLTINTVVALLMGAVAYGVCAFVTQLIPILNDSDGPLLGRLLLRLLRLNLGVFSGVLVVWWVSYWLKIKESQEISELFFRKIKNKFQKT